VSTPIDCASVLGAIDPNKQGDCFIVACDASQGCHYSQIEGTSIDACGYCAAPGTQSPLCFLGLSTPAVAGLGAGIIAAIVLAVIAALVIASIASKKGYDYWKTRQNKTDVVVTNPMYVENMAARENPFYTS
jgi:hypothetical protein